MLQFAKDGQRKFTPFANTLDDNALDGLSEEQRKAALHVLTSRDTVTGVVGKAGTGKTRMMRTTIDALQNESGLKAILFT
jgi:ABC-type methionine transport system ATPase subunit